MILDVSEISPWAVGAKSRQDIMRFLHPSAFFHYQMAIADLVLFLTISSFFLACASYWMVTDKGSRVIEGVISGLKAKNCGKNRKKLLCLQIT